jgi:hypothetical protein
VADFTSNELQQILSDIQCIKCNTANGSGGTPSSAPQIDVVQVTLCDTTTNTWHYVTTVYTNGVAGTPTSQDSGRPCSQPQPTPPTIEKIDICDNLTKTIHTQVWKYTFDNLGAVIEALVNDIDTGVACNQSFKIKTGLKKLDIDYPLLDPNTANTYDGNINKYRSLTFTAIHIPTSSDGVEITDSYGNVMTWTDPDHLPNFSWNIDSAPSDTNITLPKIRIIENAEAFITFTEQI